MSPGCAASPSLPPLPIGHPVVVTHTPPEQQWMGTVVAPGDARSVAVPCASSTVQGPYPCPEQSRQGEATWRGLAGRCGSPAGTPGSELERVRHRWDR